MPAAWARLGQDMYRRLVQAGGARAASIANRDRTRARARPRTYSKYYSLLAMPLASWGDVLLMYR